MPSLVPTSRLGLVSRKIVNVSVSVSAIYVSCPRPILNQIVQATLIKRVNFGRHGNASLSQPHQLVRSAFIHVQSVSQVLTGIRQYRPVIAINTRNSSGDEIANINFLYDDMVHVLQNTIDSCINSATDRRGYALERMFTKFSEIMQFNRHYAVQGHSRSPILVPIESSYTTSY